MFALEKVDGGAGFDEKKDLGGFVNAEKIRNVLLDAIIEDVEVFAAEACDELAARVGDEDADVDAVNADANVGSGWIALLRKSECRDHGGAGYKNGDQKSMRERHC